MQDRAEIRRRERTMKIGEKRRNEGEHAARGTHRHQMAAGSGEKEKEKLKKRLMRRKGETGASGKAGTRNVEVKSRRSMCEAEKKEVDCSSGKSEELRGACCINLGELV
uniref:Uncharacterized protein n=1 Tax=Toxoplasma gondii COUG TaxID=1074873 RepID=A0A2G8Y5Z6_TOXGO|nr:hypothetical protein TGCOUG_392550 [Toxoplasma gondii COUG]